MSVGEPFLAVFVFLRGAEFINSEKFSLRGAVSPLRVAFTLTFRDGMYVPVSASSATLPLVLQGQHVATSSLVPA